MISTFRRMIGIFRTMISVFRTMIGVFRTMIGVFRRMIGVFRRMIGTFRRMISVFRRMIAVFRVGIRDFQQLPQVYNSPITSQPAVVCFSFGFLVLNDRLFLGVVLMFLPRRVPEWSVFLARRNSHFIFVTLFVDGLEIHESLSPRSVTRGLMRYKKRCTTWRKATIFRKASTLIISVLLASPDDTQSVKKQKAISRRDKIRVDRS